jgi:hypothetical protein
MISTGAFCVVAAAFAAEVWMIISPPTTAPVDLEPLSVQFVPAVFVVPATTLWTWNVCATGAAASAAPSWRVAVFPVRATVLAGTVPTLEFPMTIPLEKLMPPGELFD